MALKLGVVYKMLRALLDEFLLLFKIVFKKKGENVLKVNQKFKENVIIYLLVKILEIKYKLANVSAHRTFCVEMLFFGG